MLHGTQINGSTIALIENDLCYNFDEIVIKTMKYRKVIRHLNLTAENKTIGIWHSNTFENICCFIACLTENVNFTILNAKDDINVTVLKSNYANVTILFSDFMTAKLNMFTMSSDFEIIKAGFIYDVTTQLRLEIKNLVEQPFNAEWENKNVTSKIADYLKSNRHFIAFHSGITNAFKASIFQLSAIEAGIQKAMELPHCKDQKIFFLENFNLLYDVVSGVIAPLFTGNTIIIDRNVENGLKYKPSVLYSNSSRFHSIVNGFYSTNKLFDFGLLKMLNIKLIKQYLFNMKFNKVFNSVKLIMLTGKLKKKDYGLKVDVINLYSLVEVASFVSYNLFRNGQITPSHLGEVSDKVNIEGFPGEIFVYAEDSSISYLEIKDSLYSFINHPFSGKLRTGDAGYIEGKNLHVLGKSKEVLVYEKELVDIESIREMAESQLFVENANVYNVEGHLILLISLNPSFLLDNDMSLHRLNRLCLELKYKINKKFTKHKLLAVRVFPDTNGFRKVDHKIVFY